MLVGIISDTHNNKEISLKAIEYLNSRGTSIILHCGDWHTPSFLETFKETSIPLKGILGNCDTALEVYKYKLEYEWKDLDLKVEIFASPLKLTIAGKRIAIVHGNDNEILTSLIESGKFDLVCYGHTHRSLIQKNGNTLIVNPGTIAGYYGVPPRITGITPTLAVYDTEKNIAEIIRLVA